MKLLRRLTFGFLYRRGMKLMSSIDTRLAEQNSYLKRLADHFAPDFSTNGELPPSTVDFIDPIEAAVAQDYVQTFERIEGRPPTEEEIVSYLDEYHSKEISH